MKRTKILAWTFNLPFTLLSMLAGLIYLVLMILFLSYNKLAGNIDNAVVMSENGNARAERYLGRMIDENYDLGTSFLVWVAALLYYLVII